MPSHWSPRAAMVACAFIVALLAPGSAHAAYHLAHVNEVQTSKGADNTAQFVELTDPDEAFPTGATEPYKIVVYDSAGTRLGATTLSQASLAAFDWSRPYLISFVFSDAATTETGDAVLATALPTSAGQVCFTSGAAESRVHCV